MAYTYRCGGEDVVLERDDDLVAVRYRQDAPRTRRADIASAGGLQPFENRIEVPGERFTVLPVAQTATPRSARRMAVESTLGALSDVARVAPVFRVGSSLVVATDRVLVAMRDTSDDGSWLQTDRSGRVVEHVGEGEMVVTLEADEDPLAVADQLASDPRVEIAEPDFVTIRSQLARDVSAPPQHLVGDPLLPLQYAMRATRATVAWESVQASPDIKVAVLDDGVDTRHADLRARVAAGYDAVDDDLYQEPNAWDGHGTACAGLAAADANNGIGVRGVAGGCGIMAVRIAYSSKPGAGWVAPNHVIARGIDWAWKNGADVLSNSWGGGAPSNFIQRAFERARTRGRGGKGCVIVIAAGNENGRVTFPANLPNVLCVAASNQWDEPKTPSSRDGEYWWGSCFGPEVSIAAPGVQNYTTDISGASGYNSGTGNVHGDYVHNFNGTSSSTPLVAGAAALVLSVNPSLTEAAVRHILMSTADKVGSTPYAEGRNDRMGHGRLNVLAAVRRGLS